jgi:uncharacterized protein YpiB (UPF0302 family)
LPSIKEKKEFIRWFLNNYQLKRRESVWILNYLLSYDQLLSNVHFIEDVKESSRGLFISAHCVEDAPFKFYKDGVLKSTDPEKCFHDVRLNRDEEIYIQLNFNSSNKCHQYLGVLEDNPYISKAEKGIAETKDSLAAIHFLEYCINRFQLESIRKEIDRTLETGDKGRFKELCEMLNTYPVVERQFETYKRPRMSV